MGVWFTASAVMPALPSSEPPKGSKPTAVITADFTSTTRACPWSTSSTKASKNASATLPVSTVTRRCVGSAAWGGGSLWAHSSFAWHKAPYAIADDLNPLGFLLLTKHLRGCCGETLKQANRIYLFCVGPTLCLRTGQALNKLDCAVTLLYAVSMGWLFLGVSRKLGWICSPVS